MVDRVDRLLRRCGLVVRAHHGDAEGAGVEADGVRADHGLADTARTAFPETAVLVREDVVSDVVPAAALRVEAVDAAEDRGNVACAVSVGTGRVVDDRCLDGARVVGGAVAHALLGAPRLAGADRRLVDLLHGGVLHGRAARDVGRVLHGRVVCGCCVRSIGRGGLGGVGAFSGVRVLGGAGLGVVGRRCGLVARICLRREDRLVLLDSGRITRGRLRVDEDELSLRGCVSVAEHTQLHALCAGHDERLRAVAALVDVLDLEVGPRTPFVTGLLTDLERHVGVAFIGHAHDARVAAGNVHGLRDRGDRGAVLGLFLDGSDDGVVGLFRFGGLSRPGLLRGLGLRRRFGRLAQRGGVLLR